MLKTPPTIRSPRADELPDNPDAIERLRKRKNANIIEGYRLRYNTTNDLPFKFYVEININNPRLWDLFMALANQLPDNLSCVFNLHDEDAISSEYKEKALIFKKLDNYKIELTQDCNIGFGIIYQSENKLEGVLVSESKYLKVWGSNEIAFRQLINDFELNEIPNLNFIDEFPTIVEPLTMFESNAKLTETVREELIDFFKPKKKSWKLW